MHYEKSCGAAGKPNRAYQVVKRKCAEIPYGSRTPSPAPTTRRGPVRKRYPKPHKQLRWPRASAPEMVYHAAVERVQLHGGISFTWGHDKHLYYKRARSPRFTFGNVGWHRERM